jgi:hypothetical protein
MEPENLLDPLGAEAYEGAHVALLGNWQSVASEESAAAALATPTTFVRATYMRTLEDGRAEVLRERSHQMEIVPLAALRRYAPPLTPHGTPSPTARGWTCARSSHITSPPLLRSSSSPLIACGVAVCCLLLRSLSVRRSDESAGLVEKASVHALKGEWLSGVVGEMSDDECADASRRVRAHVRVPPAPGSSGVVEMIATSLTRRDLVALDGGDVGSIGKLRRGSPLVVYVKEQWVRATCACTYTMSMSMCMYMSTRAHVHA